MNDANLQHRMELLRQQVNAAAPVVVNGFLSAKRRALDAAYENLRKQRELGERDAP